MKKTVKILIAIFGLGAVMLLIIHLVMLRGLTRAMRDVVLPRIKAETGIDARVGDLSLNLPAGRLYLTNLEVRNPNGFLLENLASVERIEMSVDLLSLLRGEVRRIHSVEVVDAQLNIIRNQAGEINLDRIGQPPMPTMPPPEQPVPERPPSRPLPEPREPAPPPVPSKPFPQIWIEALQGNARVRYLDFRLNELDLVLDLEVEGADLSSVMDPAARWGVLEVKGSLGSDRTRFVTDLDLRLAPLRSLDDASFDLSGRVLEIDPRIMQEAYSRMGLRSAPFGLEPLLYCRDGWFERSRIALNLEDVRFEDKLADRLGGMSSIGALRFIVPVEGSLQRPAIDWAAALRNAVGANTGSILDAFIKGVVKKEAGMDESPQSVSDAAVELLGEKVKEIGESETAKKVLKDLAEGGSSATNARSPVNTDVLVDILGEHVEEIGEDEAVKEDLKKLGKWLFGD